MKFHHMIAAIALSTSFGVYAQTTSSGAGQPPSTAATAAAPRSEGEVRKIDKEQGKVTLRHGPLQNLDMPAMTMVFKATDPKLLDGLKEGDRVMFTAEKVSGAFTVTAIEPAK